MSEQYLLEMKGICKSFPGVKALQNVDLQLKAGEVHALLGENGAGKSTLIKVLGGIYHAEEGEIIIDGQKVNIDGVVAARHAGISIGAPGAGAGSLYDSCGEYLLGQRAGNQDERRPQKDGRRSTEAFGYL